MAISTCNGKVKKGMDLLVDNVTNVSDICKNEERT